MNTYTNKPGYGPSSYDFDFDVQFDLTLNLFDYILLGFYLVFILPALLLTRLTRIIYQVIQGKMSMNKEAQRNGPSLKSSFSLMSKIF